MAAAAALVRTGMIRTPAAHRPAPSLFIYPGLTSRPFWDPAAIPLVASVLREIDVVRAECAAIRAAKHSDYIVAQGEHTLHTGAWDWHSFVRKGQLEPAFPIYCPVTAALLQASPDLLVDGVPFAYAFFSTMKPGTQIAPHFGPANIRLRVHIPIDVPTVDGAVAGLTVAGETRPWAAPLVFDDTFEHSSRNLAAADRCVLLFDVWHPDLSGAERDAVRAMFDEARGKGWLS